MSIESVELRPFDKYTIEFFTAELPYEFEEGDVNTVFTSGMPGSKELVIIGCMSPETLVDCLSMVIRQHIVDGKPAFDDYFINQKKIGKARWRLIDAEEELPEVVDFIEEQNPLTTPMVAQILWPDLEGRLPGDNGYSQFFNLQPLLKLSEDAPNAAKLWNSEA